MRGGERKCNIRERAIDALLRRRRTTAPRPSLIPSHFVYRLMLVIDFVSWLPEIRRGRQHLGVVAIYSGDPNQESSYRQNATWHCGNRLLAIVYLLRKARPRFLWWKESVKCTKRQLCRFARCPLSVQPSLQQLLWCLSSPLSPFFSPILTSSFPVPSASCTW